MTLLLLIRHGMTDATGKRITGWAPGVHLSTAGREQAERLVTRLEAMPIHAIYSSPLERCRETAAPLASARRLRARTREDLGEVRYGAWTGRPLNQLARTKLWQAVQHAPSAVRFPDGESLLEVQQRMVRELARITAAHRDEIVAVFSHGDPIRLAVAHYSGVHTDLFQRLVVETASVSAMIVGDGVPRILKVNDTGDLGALGRFTRTRATPATQRGPADARKVRG